MPPILFTMHARVHDFESPNYVGADGMRIHFDLNIAAQDSLRIPGGATPGIIRYRRTTGHIRSDGRMYNSPGQSAAPYDVSDPGTLGVRLPASDPALGLDLTYRVTMEHNWRGRPEVLRTFDTPVAPATDTTVDLAAAAPNPIVLPPIGIDPEPGPGIGIKLGIGELTLTRHRDFRWTYTNRNDAGTPTAFPSGTLLIELATTPTVTTWPFSISGSTATLKVESTAVDAIPAGTGWQLVFLPTGEAAGGDPIALGVVRFQG